MNEEQDDPKTIDLKLNEETGSFDLSDARSASPDQGRMEVMTAALGGGLTAAFAYIPNAVPTALLGIIPSQPWLVATGAAAGIAATLVLGNKFKSDFTPKEINYGRGGALVVAAAFVFGITQGLFDPYKIPEPATEPVSFEFERYTCFADKEKGQGCKYVDGKWIVTDPRGNTMVPQPNGVLGGSLPQP